MNSASPICPVYGKVIVNQLGYSRPVPLTVRPGSLHRCRPDDADPGSADCLSWIRCSIRHYVPTSVFRSLDSAFVLHRLYYCSSLLVDLPANLLQRLQSVQNSVARLIYRLRRSEHITDALLSLHWLRVRERVEYKVAVLTYKALNSLAPSYLSSAFTHVADVPSRRPPTNCWCCPTGGPRSDGGRSQLLALVSGTIFHLTLHLLRRWPSLDGA